jgi:hypothetical protein
MLNQKENYKAKKRLTKVIRRLFLQNKGLSPQVLLNATIQTQDGHVRFWRGFFGLLLIVLGIYLFLGMDWGVLVALLIIPIGILVLRDAWTGNKKKVRDYLRDLADLPDPSGLPDVDLDRLLNKVFSDCGNKFKGGGGEFGGGGASGAWETSAEVDMPSNTDIPITLESLDVSDLPVEISIGDLPDVGGGAGEMAGQIAGGILEGIFSGF